MYGTTTPVMRYLPVIAHFAPWPGVVDRHDDWRHRIDRGLRLRPACPKSQS
jgi:hypothetical protein